MLRKYLLATAILAVAQTAAQAITTIDLTTAGASGTGNAAIGGSFTVTQVGPQPTGTGFIDSFVRIRQTGSEQGYNTSLGSPLDDLAGNFTHAITLGDVPIVTVGGVEYRQFFLDINQNAEALLSLNQIQIFTNSGDMLHTSLTDATSSAQAIIGFTGATEVFRLNNDNTLGEITLNYQLNAGSGSGDMELLVANSAFGGASNTTNVILFSQFGKPPGQYSSNDGFEEWFVLSATPPAAVPEPTSVAMTLTALVGFGLVGLRRLRRRPDVSSA